MPSTYTTNLGIEKIATGEQSGTWGTTTNTNFDLIDTAVNGIVSITLASAGTSGSPNDLPITDGTASNGRNKFIEFVDGGDLGATAYVQLTPNDAEKIVHIRNSLSGSRSIIVFQGTYNASNDFEIPNGADVTLKFDGAGTGATVTDVNVDLTVTGVTATSTASFSGATIDDLGTVTTADINGGTIDGTVIGGSSAAAGTFTTANATTVDTTNLEVTNLKAKDGTSAGSIADSTGVVTLASSVLTTTDINGGTIDGATIGGTTAAAGTFTTFTSTGIDDNATSTAITIDASQNVGIGTSPSYKLDVDGTLNARGLQASGASSLSFGADQWMTQQETGVVRTYVCGPDASTYQPWEIYRATSTGGASLTMKLDASGNVGINSTTPSSIGFGTGVTKLFVSAPNSNFGCAISAVADSVGRGLQIATQAKTTTAGIDLTSSVATFYSSTDLRLYTSGGERMRLDSSGNLLVGTTSPTVTADAGFRVLSTRPTTTQVDSTSGTTVYEAYSTGAGAFRFYVDMAGTVHATSPSITSISDATLKENVRDLDKGLDTILALKPRRFDWKNGDGNDIMGFIAQEVEEVMPELVHDYKYNEDETKKALKMGDMLPSMVKAIQEQQAMIEELKAEVAALKGA